MAEKSINIIGAGVAGLSAGCYGQMNGYRTHIFEMHTRSGGLCTSWERKGYTINGCIHWFMGAGPQANHYQIWKELGAIQGKKIVYYDESIRFEESDGKVFNFYTNIPIILSPLLMVTLPFLACWTENTLMKIYEATMRNFPGFLLLFMLLWE